MIEKSNLSPEIVERLIKFEKVWLNAKVLIVGAHPWKGNSGEVIDLDMTNAGVGMKIKLVTGEECYVFKGSDVLKLKP